MSHMKYVVKNDFIMNEWWGLATKYSGTFVNRILISHFSAGNSCTGINNPSCANNKIVCDSVRKHNIK